MNADKTVTRIICQKYCARAYYCYCSSRINIPSVYGFAWNNRVDGKGVFPIIVTFEALAPLGASPVLQYHSRFTCQGTVPL